MKTKLKKLIMCPGIPRSGTTSLWKMLYDSKIVSFDEKGDYDQRDAEGFIKINSIRLKSKN